MSDSNSAQELFESAKASHLQGRRNDAERLYRAALKSSPDHVDSLHGLGVLYLQSGRLDAAVEYLRKAAAAGAGSAALYNNLGVALCAIKRFSEAAEVYRQAVDAEPDSVQSLTNLGYVLNILGRSDEAIVFLQKAVSLQPDSVEANSHLGIALVELNRPAEALAYLEKSVARDPQRVEAHNDLASALLKCGRRQEAVDRFKRALALRPDFVRALCGLGDALGSLDRHEDAAAIFERALALAPGIALVHYNYGTALTFLGRLEEANRAFARAASLAPEVPSYRYAAMAMKKTAADDPHLAALESMATKMDGFPKREQAELHLALAKAYDDLGRYDHAFEHLREGNAVKRRLVAYDEDKEVGALRAIAATFTPDFLAAHAGQGCPSEIPVFIVGMPRSGTTLVEQILASHPAVFGAGEQTVLPDLVAAGQAGANFPGGATMLQGDDWRRLGEDYTAKLRAVAPQAKRIADKMPGNFVYIGLIRLALPKARILHVQRDPLDTCFSCFTKLFDGNLNYAYDLAELGRYYRAYEALMDHWRRALPQDAMLDVCYEELIGDFEPQARRIVAYCGLEWDERCLAFHQSKRAVRTASTFQVRRPLYKSAIGRAIPYVAWLAPLRAALGQAQQDDDA